VSALGLTMPMRFSHPFKKYVSTSAYRSDVLKQGSPSKVSAIT